jgi:hypothetical protein
MKRTVDTKKSLQLRKETLRQLDPATLDQVGGGVKRVYAGDFDWAAYLKACMGTTY